MTMPMSQVDEVVAPAPKRRPRNGTVLFATVVVMASIVIAGVLVVARDDDAPDTDGQVSLAAEPTAGGLTLTRTWALTGEEGDQFVATTVVENPTDAPITETVFEIIPKSVATSADDITVDSGPATRTVIKSDPVFSFQLTVPANSEQVITMRVRVPPDGRTTDRVRMYLSERRAAVADFYALYATTTTTASPTTTTPTTSTAPVANRPPVIAFNDRVIDMANDRVPSWDHFWIYSSVSDPDGDEWSFSNNVRTASSASVYTGACAEDPDHGCIWYFDNGTCHTETFFVTVLDAHGNLSNEGQFYAQYC